MKKNLNLNLKGVPPRPKTIAKPKEEEQKGPNSNPWGVDENKYYVDVGGISDFINF